MKQIIIKNPEADVRSLLEGIVLGSDEEIAALTAETTAYAAAKAKATEAKIKAIANETDAAILEQTNAMRRNLDSRLALERKKADLGARDRLVRAIESRARSMLEETATMAEYREVLLDWTVEAAVGLGSCSATVNTCQTERSLIDEGFLREAETRVFTVCGRTASLRLAEKSFLNDRGIELVADGGRLSYDNRIGTRFARAAGIIRSIVYKVAYRDENDIGE